jgi:outer membrane protein OmpA-like peptidoglycan-associated protein
MDHNQSTTRWFNAAILLVFLSSPTSAQQETDYLSFAHGAFPVSIDGDGPGLKTGFEHALAAIDENAASVVMTPKWGGPQTTVDIVYELPALTTFEGFAVPGVHETPSPSQTFFKHIAVSGSVDGPDGPFVPLGSTELETHTAKDQLSTFATYAIMKVRWIKLSLSGGIDIQTDKTFFEFTEIIGRGHQEPVPMSERFTGKWKGRGVLMELHQEGAMVNGCYDKTGELSGAVTGTMLYASGVNRDDRTSSSFVLTVTPDGSINGVRSSNGAPFRIYTAGVAPKETHTGCSRPEQVTLGCGSIVYGIQFDYDSAEIKAESEQVLTELYRGLNDSAVNSILIKGHTSAEGSESYNQGLSERRAQAVVESLVRRGLDSNRVSAAGMGENEPIATNEDEAGRILNRRVEVECSP